MSRVPAKATMPDLLPDLLAPREPAWLEAEYNNRARVSDSAEVLARWADEAAAARAAMIAAGRARLDLAYGHGPTDRIDVFWPRRAITDDEEEHGQGAPVLVFIHGGWWRALSKSDFSQVAPAFTRAGAVVMVPEYSLCPAVSIADICLQMTRALIWIYRHADRYGGDPKRIVLVGHSAGAHLAAMMMACHWPALADEVAGGLPAQLVRAALAISGVYELGPVSQVPFLQADLKLSPEEAARLSPARFPTPRGAKLLATVGAQESPSFLAQNEAIHQAWGPKAVPVCEAIPNTNHFTVVDDFIQPGGRQHGLAWELLDGTA
jgi:arylformamidase